jgi:hypothetical protein
LYITTLAFLDLRSVRGVKINSFHDWYGGSNLLIDLENPVLIPPESDNIAWQSGCHKYIPTEQYCIAFEILFSNAPETPVYIWGFKDGERCAVIGRRDLLGPGGTQAIYIIGF